MVVAMVDEYRLFIHPVALGGGGPLFPVDHDRTKLELLDARPFSNAVIATHYRTVP
jgi:dihydrofolate reductase